MNLNVIFQSQRKTLGLLLTVVGLAYGLLFFQIYKIGDYPDHLEFAEKWAAGVLVIPHFAFHLVLIVVRYLTSSSFETAQGIVLTAIMLFVTYLIFRYLREVAPHMSLRVIAIGTLSLMFWGPASIVVVFYGVLRNNPFYETYLFAYPSSYSLHNPTSMAILPFIFLLYWLCIRLFDREQGSWRTVLSLVLVTTVGTLIKPNYLIAFVPAVMLFWLIYPNKRRFVIGLFGVMIPSLLILIWQYFYWFNSSIPDYSTGVGIEPFKVLISGNDKALLGNISPYLAIFMSIFLSLLYVVAIARYYPIWQDKEVQLALLTIFIAILQGILFVEYGSRMAHGNFLWGGKLANFVLSIVMMGYLFRQHTSKSIKRINRWILIAYILHVASGVVWYINFLKLALSTQV